jgi:hypothetical protein
MILIALLLSSCSPSVKEVLPQAGNGSSTGGASTTSKAYPTAGSGDQQSSGTGEKAYPAGKQAKIYAANETPPVPEKAPSPKPGKASISGTLFSYTTRITIPGTQFYLIPSNDKKIPALIVGPDPSKGDIISRTDENGQIAMDDIAPGNYYIAVWDNYSWTPVVDPSKQDAPPRLIELKEGDAQPLGLMNVVWP